MKKLKNICWVNHVGSKGKFFPKIEHLLPKEDNIKCLDLFSGGTSLSAMLPNSWEIECNDKCWDLGKMQGQFLSDYKDSGKSPEDWVKELASSMMVKNRLDEEGYISAKKQYNLLKDSARWERSYVFFELVCSSFSNYIRFNEEGEWNLNFGKRYFNPSMQKKLVQWLKNVEHKDISFNFADWKEWELSGFDFLIVDPPYLNTIATYNKSWGKEDTTALLKALDDYAEQGGKFIFFEEVLSKGKPNTIVTEWMSKYKHISLGDESVGCNYQRKDGVTLEVCVYN